MWLFSHTETVNKKVNTSHKTLDTCIFESTTYPLLEETIWGLTIVSYGSITTEYLFHKNKKHDNIL